MRWLWLVVFLLGVAADEECAVQRAVAREQCLHEYRRARRAAAVALSATSVATLSGLAWAWKHDL